MLISISISIALVLLATTPGSKAPHSWLRRRRLRQALATELEQARERLEAARVRRDVAISREQARLDKAHRAHEEAVRLANSRLRDANSFKGSRVAAYRGVVLFERWIETPHGCGPIAAATAVVDSQVGSRFTATRIVGLGALALAAPKQTGSLYLQINSSKVTSVIECPAAEAAVVREVAVLIANLGKAEASTKHELDHAVERAQQELDRVKSDFSEVSAAEEALESRSNDRHVLELVRARERDVAEVERRLNELSS